MNISQKRIRCFRENKKTSIRAAAVSQAAAVLLRHNQVKL